MRNTFKPSGKSRTLHKKGIYSAAREGKQVLYDAQYHHKLSKNYNLFNVTTSSMDLEPHRLLFMFLLLTVVIPSATNALTKPQNKQNNTIDFSDSMMTSVLLTSHHTNTTTLPHQNLTIFASKTPQNLYKSSCIKTAERVYPINMKPAATLKFIENPKKIKQESNKDPKIKPAASQLWSALQQLQIPRQVQDTLGKFNSNFKKNYQQIEQLLNSTNLDDLEKQVVQESFQQLATISSFSQVTQHITGGTCYEMASLVSFNILRELNFIQDFYEFFSHVSLITVQINAEGFQLKNHVISLLIPATEKQLPTGLQELFNLSINICDPWLLPGKAFLVEQYQKIATLYREEDPTISINPVINIFPLQMVHILQSLSPPIQESFFNNFKIILSDDFIAPILPYFKEIKFNLTTSLNTFFNQTGLSYKGPIVLCKTEETPCQEIAGLLLR